MKTDKPLLLSCLMDQIGVLFAVPREHVFLCKDALSIISLRFPRETIHRFEFAPLDYSQITALKQSAIQTLKFNDHQISLENWNILEDVKICGSIDSNGQSIVKKAFYLNQVCMAFQYSSSEKEVGFVKYLENLLNSNYNPHMPAIKGLCYPKQVYGQELQYPLLIFEKYELMQTQITQHVKEVDQLSFLLDIASCLQNWKKTSQSVKLSVHLNTIFVCRDGDTWRAKVCPLYGHNCESDHSQVELPFNLAMPLSLDELSWMRDVVQFLNFKGKKLSEDHLLKNMFDQKWLSKEDRFRPSSYKKLCEDLQNLLGKCTM